MSKEKEIEVVPRLRFPEFSSEWKESLLGNTARFINGRAYKQEELLDKGKYKVLRVGNFFTNHEWYYSNLELENDKYCKDGDLLYAWSASFGPRIWNGEKSIYHYHIWKVVKSERINKMFLYILLDSETKRMKSQSANGFALLHITKGTIESWKCCIPISEKEQQKIADCLSSLNDLITAENQKLEAFKAHKKGLMQQLFPAEGEAVPKLRFAEFRDSGEWVTKTIGDFVHSHKGGAPLTPSDFASYSNYEVIPKKAISEGIWLKLDTKNPTYCSENFFNDNTNSVVNSEYLLTTLRDLVPSGPNIGYIVKYVGTKKFILAQGVYGIKLKETIIPEFLIHFSNTTLYRKLVNAVMVGSTQVHIRNSVFFSLAINVPSLEEQRKVADCLSFLDDLIIVQTETIEALQQHKKGLMQGLFPKPGD